MLTATHLRHSFGSGASRVTVLRNASLQLQGGELTLISGPSGCGKSTLLAILSGLLAPDRGTVSALGHDLRQMSVAERDRFRLLHTGFVFQTFNLFAGLSALEQVCLPLAYLGSDRSQATDKALQALRAVGLESRAHMRPAALSGGEQQRVAVARAIAKAPRFLFADEPTSALDSINGDTVTQRLREIAHDTGAVVLCVSHDPRMVARADRVLEMQDGEIESDSYRQLRAPHLARAIP